MGLQCWAHMRGIALVIVFVSMFSGAEAQQPKASSRLQTQLKRSIPSTESAHLRALRSSPQIEVGYRHSGYLMSAQELNGVTQFSEASANLVAQGRSGDVVGFMDLSGFFSTNIENYNMLIVPEAYLKWVPFGLSESRSGVVVGRKFERWSLLDSQWQLGLWQPLARWDYLRPVEQGLTGTFLDFQSHGGGFRVLLFGSSIFLPEQNPPYQLQNGKFSSPNPYFSEPPNTLVLFKEKTDVQYELRTPEAGNVISQVSLGGLVRVGDPDDEAWLQAAYIYKPRNQISLPFEAQLRHDQQSAQVIVVPHVEYHHLASVDVGYTGRWLQPSFSILREIPVDSVHEKELNYQKLRPLTLWSPSLQVRTGGKYWAPILTVAYLDSRDDGSESHGPLVGSSSSVFGSRVNFQQAVSGKAQMRFYQTSTKVLDFSTQFIHELKEKGSILLADLRFQFATSWQLFSGIEVLGSNQPNDESSTTIAKFRRNDRMFGGLSYVF